MAVGEWRIAPPGEPDALTPKEQGAVERAGERRGTRDDAVLAVLFYTGARAEECARLDVERLAITARTGTIHLHGRGDQVRQVPLPAPARDRLTAWIRLRATSRDHCGPGSVAGSLGITQVVLAVGADAGLPGLRPQRLRHTYATRLRQGGADRPGPGPARPRLPGHHRSLLPRRAAEQAAVVERVFE